MLIGTNETIFCILCLLVGSGVLAFGFWSARRERDLRLDGRQAQGKVIRIKQRELRTESDGYTLVSYRDQAGELRTRRVGARSGIQVGDPVTVWYDPDEPTRAATHLDVRMRRVVFLCGAIAVALGMLGVGLAVVQALR